MNILLLIAALTAPPVVELHVVPHTAQGAHLRRCITCDIPCVCEDTRAIAHFQHQLRTLIVFKNATDEFGVIGRHKFRLPEYRHPCIVVLCLKRELDLYAMPRRKFAEVVSDYDRAKQFGQIDIGSAEFEDVTLPMPWEANYQLTAFLPPGEMNQ